LRPARWRNVRSLLGKALTLAGADLALPGRAADLEVRLAGADPLADLPFRPLRPATLRTRRLHALTLASALVHRGRDSAGVTGLAALVEPAALREALRFVLGRSGGKPTPYLRQLAVTALLVARHWAKVPQAQEQALQAIARRCEPPGGPPGLTAKNRAALRRLEDDPALVRKLLALPERLARGLERGRGPLPRRDALRLQAALAVGILLAAPIRVANLAGLRLDRHLLRQGRGPDQRVHLALPASEVKNGQDLEHPLPPWVVELLDLYLARGRPALQAAGAGPGSGPDPWLFPGARTGEGKTVQALRQQVKDATEKGLGLRLTPHQFRHACGLVYLMADPGGHEVVRHLLGHRSIATTVKHYAGMEAAAALRHYDAVVLERRQEGTATLPHGGGRRRG
jgi:integrase